MWIQVLALSAVHWKFPRSHVACGLRKFIQKLMLTSLREMSNIDNMNLCTILCDMGEIKKYREDIWQLFLNARRYSAEEVVLYFLEHRVFPCESWVN